MDAAEADRRITRLFEDHYRAVLSYCRRRTYPSEAEDAAAEVFGIAWNKREEIIWESARPWLFGVARGVVANRNRGIRRAVRVNQRIMGLARVHGDPVDVLVARRDDAALAALARLGDPDREILMLAAWEDLTTEEIGAALGITRSAAAQRLHRAKKRYSRSLRAIRSLSNDPSPPPEVSGEH